MPIIYIITNTLIILSSPLWILPALAIFIYKDPNIIRAFPKGLITHR